MPSPHTQELTESTPYRYSKQDNAKHENSQFYEILRASYIGIDPMRQSEQQERGNQRSQANDPVAP